MSKAEEEPVSEYGEPWSELIFGFGWVEDTHGNEVNLMYERHRLRAIACVNALSGIPNTEAVRELVSAAQQWAYLRTIPASAGMTEASEKILFEAVESLSAPSTGAQQK